MKCVKYKIIEYAEKTCMMYVQVDNKVHANNNFKQMEEFVTCDF